MDIAARIGLRTSARKNNKAVMSAVWMALVIHAVAWFYWNPFEKISAPELPDWVNITLVAGFEDNRNEQKPEPQPVSIPKPKPVAVKPPEQETVSKPLDESAVVNEMEEQAEPPQQKEVEPSSANTFVQADSRPFVLDNPKPVYPSSARRRGMQGGVLLQINVSEEGHVTGIHIMRSSGFRVLDIAALNSVKRWRFMPARQGDSSVASSVQVPIRFTLNNP